MEDRAADEPDQDVESSREARIEHAADGVDHERDREQMAGEVQRGRPVAAPCAGDHDAIHVRLATHFVQCTPGSAGTMIRAG